MLRVGTCGWSSLPARNIFGSDWKTKFDSKLQAYATISPAVEVNSTFYRIPRVSTAEKWREQTVEVNRGFKFTLKANQLMTHKDRFRTSRSRKMWNETIEIAETLKADVVLIQTPTSFRPTAENVSVLESFLDYATTKWRGEIAWEPRGEWLLSEELDRVLGDFNIIHCVDPFRNEPRTDGQVYWRAHGLGEKSMYNHRFNDNELHWLADKARGHHGYLFFNNIWMSENAISFLSIFSSMSAR